MFELENHVYRIKAYIVYYRVYHIKENLSTTFIFFQYTRGMKLCYRNIYLFYGGICQKYLEYYFYFYANRNNFIPDYFSVYSLLRYIIPRAKAYKH